MPAESKRKGSFSENFSTAFSILLISAAMFSHDNMKKKKKKSENEAKAFNKNPS